MNKKIALLEISNAWSIWITEDQLPFTIGRHYSNDLVINSNSVSRKHCEIISQDGCLQILDTGSYNGTIIQDQLITESNYSIEERSLLLLGDTMIWVTPCNNWGQPIINTKSSIKLNKSDAHGICLVDICDSTEQELSIVDHSAKLLRKIIQKYNASDILFLKHMGDGYMCILKSPVSSALIAERLLEWQSSNKNIHDVDIRVTLDAGPTFQSSGNDRLGTSIIRAARIEKTQLKDIDVPGKEIEKLKPRNRSLITEYLRKMLNNNLKDSYVYIGKRKLKGFSDKLFPIYQNK